MLVSPQFTNKKQRKQSKSRSNWKTFQHDGTIYGENSKPRKTNKITLRIASESIHSIKHMTNLNKKAKINMTSWKWKQMIKWTINENKEQIQIEL